MAPYCFRHFCRFLTYSQRFHNNFPSCQVALSSSKRRGDLISCREQTQATAASTTASSGTALGSSGGSAATGTRGSASAAPVSPALASALPPASSAVATRYFFFPSLRVRVYILGIDLTSAVNHRVSLWEGPSAPPPRERSVY
jgi:hypothetical protein